MEAADIKEKPAGGGGICKNTVDFTPIKKERFLNVEFLRFICAVMIFLHHYCNTYRFGHFGKTFDVFMKNTHNAYMPVQYFFIIAGFLLIYTINTKQPLTDFIKKKIIRLWPLIAFLFILYILADLFGITKFQLYPNILSLLFLENAGVTLKWGNIGHDWFLSVLFFISIFYFYIFKFFDKKIYNFFIPIGVLICYTFLINVNHGGIGGHIKTTAYIFNHGIIQGIAGMGFGYMLHEFYQYIKSQQFVNTVKSVILYSIIEGYLLGFVVYETCLHKMRFNNNIILVIAFAALFLTFLLKRGFVSRLFENKFSEMLGRYAFALYMTHAYLWNILYKIWIKHHSDICIAHPYLSIFVSFFIAIIFAILTYHFVEVPAGKYLKKKFFPEKL